MDSLEAECLTNIECTRAFTAEGVDLVYLIATRFAAQTFEKLFRAADPFKASRLSGLVQTIGFLCLMVKTFIHTKVGQQSQMLFARRQYLRAARLVALIISLVLLEVVYPAPPVHASGAGPFLIQTNGFGFPNPGPANNYFIQDKFGRLGYFSFDTSPSSGPDFYYSNNDGMTWTRDTSGVTTALLGDNDIGRGLFSSDGNFLIALRNTAPSSIAAISRFTVNRDVNNNIVSFVNTGNTDIVTGFVVNAGSALALNPDSSNAVIIGMSSVAAPNRNCFLQATISLAGYSNMAGIPNMIDCQTLDQNTQPILAIHPTSNAVMETGVDDFAPGGCGNGCGANYMLTIPHSGSGTWNFTARTFQESTGSMGTCNVFVCPGGSKYRCSSCQRKHCLVCVL